MFENPLYLVGLIVLAIILPLAAAVIQMAISRNREYMADEGAARLTRHPEWLQSALAKLSNYNRQGNMQSATQESAHMFIINPMVGIGESLSNLFSTHPRTEERIAKLKQQAMNPKYKEKALF